MFTWIPLNKQLSLSFCLLPHCRLPCRGRRWQCCSGRPWSRLVAASPSLPASCSSCWDTWTSHNCCLLNMFKVGTLLLHLSKLQKHFPLSGLMTKTYLVGETTSKQKRRSMSSQCLTVHSLRSSTTTVGLSWGYRTGALVTIMLETIFETTVIPSLKYLHILVFHTSLKHVTSAKCV